MLPPGFQSYTTDEIRENLKRDIINLPENSYNLIISGDANDAIWAPTEQFIMEAHSKKNCKFEFILGPIVSANEKDRSAIIELAEQKYIDLYVSYRRQRKHGRLFALGKDYQVTEMTHSWIEMYHEVLDRSGRRIAKRFLPSTEMGRYEIECFISRFKFLKSSEYYHYSTNPEKDFIVLSDTSIEDLLKKIARQTSLSFDFINKQTIEEYI